MTVDKSASSADLLENDFLENEHPGLALREDYLEPLGITAYNLAKGTGLSQIHISEILRGRRSITPMTSLLLGKFFRISPRFWLNMQNHYDLLEAERANPERIKQAVYDADLQAA